MGRGINLLTARFVATTTELGRHSDGGGLSLLVRQRGDAIERLWVFRYKRGGRGKVKETTLSLGAARDITLADVRVVAGRCREALARGADPKTVIAPAGGIPTFGAFADDLIETLKGGFRNEKHKYQWGQTLGDDYCAELRKKPINEVGTADVLGVLQPIWLTKPETASRLRGRIERVLDAAKAKGLREGDNPARWRGHLKLLLPKQEKLIRGHHKAMPWAELPAFMARLRTRESISAVALEWTILTASRTGETIGTPKKGEVDVEAAVWTVPPERMKGKRQHRVPLCARCLEIFEDLKDQPGPWLFPSVKPRHPLSNMAMMECLKDLVSGITVHGFRSTFRDWAGDSTSFPRELVEAALAHVVGDEVERAYRRGDALARRRKLMEAWSGFCAGAEARGNVKQFARKA